MEAKSSNLIFLEIRKMFLETHKTFKLHPFEDKEEWCFEKYKNYMLEQQRLAENGDANAKRILESTMEILTLCKVLFSHCPFCKRDFQ